MSTIGVDAQLADQRGLIGQSVRVGAADEFSVLAVVDAFHRHRRTSSDPPTELAA